MLPEHSLPQLILGRAQAALTRIDETIWTRVASLNVEASAAQQQQLSLAEGKQLARRAVEEGSSWGRLFDQRWCHVELPQVTDGKTWIFWVDQGEATLYVNDQPHFGFNVAHRYCHLPEGLSELWLQSSCIQSAIWHPNATEMKLGCLFEGAYLAHRDEEAWGAYHDLKCLLDLAVDQRKRENPSAPAEVEEIGLTTAVEKASPAYRLLLRFMNEAVDAYDVDGLPAMRSYLKSAYAKLRCDGSFSKCVLTGHAHVDLVWIWPERMGELKAVNVFATANHLMQQYPEYRFAYSQPASYEAVERREPGLMATVKDRMKSGEWQATGAMYVESDTIFACGEALARSFTLGQKYFESMNGMVSKLTWLPDVFGYAACLPQIMKQTGVEYFFTTKMTWNAINRFPYSSFIWRGNDGSEVLAHVTQESGYVTHMEVDHVKAPMHANQQAAQHDEYLLPVGYGDGGGGVTDVMLERARRLQKLPTMPDIAWDQPEAFFERLGAVADQLPVHQGECYLEYHRGTYTTHGNLKASFRNLERAMQVAEAVSVATGKTWDMEHAWKRLVFAQFHDYIPGSSVWDVYIEGLPELDGLAAGQFQQAVAALSGEGEACLFNPHALPVHYWHAKGDSESVRLTLPALSGTTVQDAIDDQQPEVVSLDGRTVSNGLAEFTLNEDGWIEQLIWEGVCVPQSAPLGQLVVYPDRAANFDSWDIDRHVLALGEVCDTAVTIESYQRPHAAGFRVSRAIGKQSHATVTFEIQAGSPLVHISVDVDWQDTESLLKLYFPTQYAAANARYGVAYGSVLRPQLPGSMTAEAMWEVPFSRHMAVFDEGEREGMCFITEAKYGASVRSGAVGLSLIRSPKVTGFDGPGEAWPPHLSQYKDVTQCSDIGLHSIKLAIGRYESGLPRERQPAALADTLFTPPVAYTGSPIASMIESIEGGSTLVPSWVKPVEGGGWILRLQEVAGQRGQVTVQFVDGASVALTNLGEIGIEPMNANGSIDYAPYQVISLRVT